MQRDPRVDPKAGDRLRMVVFGTEEEDVLVLWITLYPDFLVAYTIPRWDERTPFKIITPLWREWARNAEVVHVEP